MADAQLQPIYDRLNGVENYKPYTAGTFADWSLEAGDIVTTVRDGVEYSSPVHVSNLQWNGRQKVNIECHGEQTRGSVAKMSIRSYNGSNGGGNGYRGYRNTNKKNKEKFTLLDQTDEEIKLEAYDLKKNTEAQFKVTAEQISAEVKARTKQGEELTGRLDVEAGRISAVVTRDGKIRAGMIVDAINEDSSVKIKADRIVLEGNTTINDIFRVSSVGVFVAKPMLVGASALASVYMGENRVMAGSFQVRGRNGSGRTLNVADLEVNGNNLIITYADGSRQNFSKATSLNGVWSSSERKFTVTASPQGKTLYTALMDHLYDVDFGSGYTSSATIKAVIEGKGETAYNAGTVQINAYQAYQNGKNSVTPDRKTQYNPMTCTSAVPQGGGQSNYKFEATLPTNRFHQNSSYDFWAIP